MQKWATKAMEWQTQSSQAKNIQKNLLKLPGWISPGRKLTY
jgi:hypothetical protein